MERGEIHSEQLEIVITPEILHMIQSQRVLDTTQLDAVVMDEVLRNPVRTIVHFLGFNSI